MARRWPTACGVARCRSSEALRTAREIADALDRAHRTGIVHRDLKPGNIMLTKDGAKVLDFGLAKMRAQSAGMAVSGGSVMQTLTSPLTGEGSIVGTLQYMAPEQLEGKDADARSDIFSFGAVLYEMATGRKPFDSRTQAGLIAQIMQTDPPGISTILPQAPAALEQLARTCLAKDPDQRRQTMRDVLTDLDWIASSASRQEPAKAVKARRGLPIWIWQAAAAVLFAVATIALIAASRLRPAATPPLPESLYRRRQRPRSASESHSRRMAGNWLSWRPRKAARIFFGYAPWIRSPRVPCEAATMRSLRSGRRTAGLLDFLHKES